METSLFEKFEESLKIAFKNFALNFFFKCCKFLRSEIEPRVKSRTLK
jgi:hypothetical protein